MNDQKVDSGEVMDLVDENDQVIGEVLKSEANRNSKLLHREAGVLLFTDDKRLLLQRRSLKKLVQPGEWQITAAGHVTKGLTPLEAAHKELKEELGFDTDLKYVEKRLVAQANETHFTYHYLGKYLDQDIVIEKDEVEDARLFTQKEFEYLVKSGARINLNSQNRMERFWAGEFDHIISSFRT